MFRIFLEIAVWNICGKVNVNFFCGTNFWCKSCSAATVAEKQTVSRKIQESLKLILPKKEKKVSKLYCSSSKRFHVKIQTLSQVNMIWFQPNIEKTKKMILMLELPKIDKLVLHLFHFIFLIMFFFSGSLVDYI